jgi:hypothetical protein
MAEREKHLLDNMDGSATYWQYLHKAEEHDGQQVCKQAGGHTADDSGILLYAILFTIGFLALLVITTLRNIV